MKYNSIGEQLIAKAQELDPNYKPDKFNDMSEAIDVILNNSGSGSAKLYLDITPYITQTTELNGTITQEGFNLIQTKLDNGEIIGINMGGTLFNYAYFNTYSVDSSAPIKTRIIFLHNAENEIYLKLTIDEALTWSAEPELISNGGGIPTANVNSETFKLDTSSLTNKDQYVIASMDDGGGNIQYIPLQTYFTNAGYFNKEVKMQNYSRGFSLSLTDISFTSTNNYTVNAKNTNVDFTSSLDSSKTWNKKGELKYITIEEQNILTGEKTYDYLEISGGDYSTEISTLNSRVDSLNNDVAQLLSYNIDSLDSRITQLENDISTINALDSRVNDLENTIIKEIPPLPSDANTKTYVLKAVNGVFTWSE